MKVLNLNRVGNFNKNIEGNENDIGLYTYNVFNKKFDDYNNFVHYLNWEVYESDLNELDNYIKYIYNIIENSDYVLMSNLSGDELNRYISSLKHTYYDKIILEDCNDNIFNTNYLFDIKDATSKQFLRDNFKFNLSDEYREPIIVNTDKKYILNEDRFDYIYINYVFIKNNYLQLILYQQDGYIYDYRPYNVREKEIKKYKK